MGRNKWPDSIIIHQLRRDTLSDYEYYLSPPGQLLNLNRLHSALTTGQNLQKIPRWKETKVLQGVSAPGLSSSLRLLPALTAFTTPAGGSVEHCCYLQRLFPHKGQTSQWLGSRILSKAEVKLRDHKPNWVFNYHTHLLHTKTTRSLRQRKKSGNSKKKGGRKAKTTHHIWKMIKMEIPES